MHGLSCVVSLSNSQFSFYLEIYFITKSPSLSLHLEAPLHVKMQPSDVSATVAKKNKEKEKKRPSVSVFKLFSFADSYDCVLMTLGSIGACIHGASVPVFFIFFGKLINIIGLAYLFPQEASHKVAKVIYIFIIIYPKLLFFFD